MPTGRAVTVATVTLTVASTHLSVVLVQTFAVVTLTETSCYQTLAIGVVTHAAAAVTGACVGAHYSLWVSAQLLALLVGQVTVFLVLAGLPEPVLITLTLPTVTHTMASTSLPVICSTDPVMAFTAWSIVVPWLCDLAYASPTVTLSPTTADKAFRGLAPPLGRLSRQRTYLPQRL